MRNKRLLGVLFTLIFVLGACSRPDTTSFLPTATSEVVAEQPTPVPTQAQATEPVDETTVDFPPDFFSQTEESTMQEQDNPDLSVLFLDDFEPGNANWSAPEDEFGRLVFADGEMRLGVVNKDSYFYYAMSNSINYGDVLVSVNTNEFYGSGSNARGLICRSDGNNQFYGFMIAPDNRAVILKGTDAGIEVLYSDTSQTDPLKGTDDRIAAICAEETLALMVNDRIAAITTDDAYKQGDVGVVVMTFDDSDATISFDHFLVQDGSSPDEQTPSAESTESPLARGQAEFDAYLGLPSTIVYSHDFGDGSGVFPDESSDDVETGMADDAYVMTVKTPNSYYLALTGSTNIDQAVVAVETTFGVTDPEKYYGVACRVEDDINFYGMGVSSQQGAVIFKVIDGTFEILIHGVDDRIDPNGNEVIGTCVDDVLMLVVNGNVLLRAVDRDLTIGDTGFFAMSLDGVPIDIFYEKFTAVALQK